MCTEITVHYVFDSIINISRAFWWGFYTINKIHDYSFSKLTILLVGSAFDLLLLELPLIHSTKGSCIRVFNTLYGRNNNLIMFMQALNIYYSFQL